jgi:hypothetical protein
MARTMIKPGCGVKIVLRAPAAESAANSGGSCVCGRVKESLTISVTFSAIGPIGFRDVSDPMRSVPAIALAVLLGVSAAHAEKRIFIIANHSDGYGVDRCLAAGASCGAAAATALCKAREFSRAVSYRKVDREEITGAVPTIGAACRGGACDAFVAIECTR